MIMDDDLRPMERAALLTLLLAARSLSNTEMDEIAHFRLIGDDVTRLNKKGLVKSHTDIRPYVHTLTDGGREWCLRELTAGSPRSGDTALENALYTVLAAVRRHVDMQRLFPCSAKATQPAQAGVSDVESAIRSTYRKLVREPGGWVNLADLRASLDTVLRTDLDVALKRMIRQPDVVIIPEADQAALKRRDREAAVRIGGEEKHLLSIEGS